MSVLYLLRHAQAQNQSPSGRDFDRPLSTIGQKQAAQAAQWLLRAPSPPQQVIASPAARTQQTARVVCRALQLDDKALHLEASVYEASAGTLLAMLQQRWSGESVLLVGHNPGVELLLKTLAEPSSGAAVPRMAPASLARIFWPQPTQALIVTGSLSNLVHHPPSG